MQRLDHTAASPEGYKKLLAVSAFLAHSGLEPSLLELISIRASEINGCAWCLDFHTKRQRSNGPKPLRSSPGIRFLTTYIRVLASTSVKPSSPT